MPICVATSWFVLPVKWVPVPLWCSVSFRLPSHWGMRKASWLGLLLEYKWLKCRRKGKASFSLSDKGKLQEVAHCLESEGWAIFENREMTRAIPDGESTANRGRKESAGPVDSRALTWLKPGVPGDVEKGRKMGGWCMAFPSAVFYLQVPHRFLTCYGCSYFKSSRHGWRFLGYFLKWDCQGSGTVIMIIPISSTLGGLTK